MDLSFIHQQIKQQEYDLSDHAHRERQEEQISIKEIEKVLLKGVIIERYPKDLRGESCLVAGKYFNKMLHVVCETRNDRLLIVTVYRPKLPVWISLTKRSMEVKSRV